MQDIIHGILQFLFFQRTYHSSLTSEMQIIAKRQKKVITEVIYLWEGEEGVRIKFRATSFSLYIFCSVL